MDVLACTHDDVGVVKGDGDSPSDGHHDVHARAHALMPLARKNSFAHHHVLDTSTRA